MVLLNYANAREIKGMKKAIVVGGANGIGASVARELMSRGYYTVILDTAIRNDNLNAY